MFFDCLTLESQYLWEKLGEIVAYKAESGMGIRNKVHVDAEAARKAAEAKIEQINKELARLRRRK